jgi:hypothetical protein
LSIFSETAPFDGAQRGLRPQTNMEREAQVPCSARQLPIFSFWHAGSRNRQEGKTGFETPPTRCGFSERTIPELDEEFALTRVGRL